MTTIQQLWQQIEEAGNVDAFIAQQLEQKDFLVTRRDTDHMKPRELENYKKALKQEAAEKRLLQQQVWQAYRQHNIVTLGDGIYWNDRADHDRFDIEDAAKRRIENALPAFKTPQALAEALQLSVQQLRWLAFNREVATTSHYQHFTIAKRSGGERAIWAPKPTLKCAQRWILRHIVEHLPIHSAAHGFVAGRSTFSNAAIHQDMPIIVKVDLKDFFPSIHWKRIKGVFRHAGYQEQIATLLALLCTESPRQIVQDGHKTVYVALADRCLPQGAPTSPALTNVLCMRLDQRLTGLIASLGGHYSRYADDLTFSLRDAGNISVLLGSLQRIVADEGFAVNPRKTRILRDGVQQHITGLVINAPHAPRVPRQLKRQLRAAVHNLQQGKGLRSGESIQRLKGYAAYLAMTDPALGQHYLSVLKAFSDTADINR